MHECSKASDYDEIREPRRDVTHSHSVTRHGPRGHPQSSLGWAARLQPAAVRLAPVVRLAAALLFLSARRAGGA